MSGRFDIERAAKALAQAWHAGSQPAELRSVVRPTTLNEGYALQDRFITLLGEPVIGWKIGLAGRNAYSGARLARPIFGRLLASRCYRNGDEVPVPQDTKVTVELELALVLGEDITGDAPITPDQIASAHLGFEIVSSRIPDRGSIGVPATVADNAVSHAVVLGDAVDLRRFADIAANATVTIGDQKVPSLEGEDLPDPLSVLGHLAAHLGERRQFLKRGDVVFSGTLTKPVDVTAPCDLIGGDTEPRVRCRLRAAQ